MNILTMKLYILLSLLFLMIDGTLQEYDKEADISTDNSEEEKPNIDQYEEKKINEKLDITESVKEELGKLESSNKDNGKQKLKVNEENLKSGENESTKEDTQPSNQLEEDAFQEFGTAFLSKLDGELKKKVQSKIEGNI